MSDRVIAIHGMLGTPSLWDAIVDHLTEDFSLETASLPGHGPAPGGMAPTWQGTIDAWADQVGLGEGTTLVGYSAGGRFALGVAARFPHLIHSVFAIGAQPGLVDPRARIERSRWDRAQAEALRRDGLEAFVDAWERMPLFDSQRFLSSDAWERQRFDRLSHTVDGLAWAFEVLGTGNMPDLRPDLRRWLTLPGRRLAWVAGQNDAKYVAEVESAGRDVTGSTVHLIADAGHNPVLECPESVSEHLRCWWRSDRSR